MFPDLFNVRRVGRARKRLTSLVSDESTIPVLLLQTSFDNVCSDFTNFHSTSLNFVQISNHEWVSVCHITPHIFCDFDVQLAFSGSDSFENHLASLRANKCCNADYEFASSLSIVHLPLSKIIQLFVDVLSPNCIFMLDTLLSNYSCKSSGCLSHSNQNNLICVNDVKFCNRDCTALLLRSDFILASSSKRKLSSVRSMRLSPSTCISICDLNIIHRIGRSSYINAKCLKKFYCVDLLMAICKAWRWSNLHAGDWIRCIGPCRGSWKTKCVHQVCLNPYHWSRVICSNYLGNQLMESSAINGARRDPDLFCVGRQVHYYSTEFELNRKSSLSNLSVTTHYGRCTNENSSVELPVKVTKRNSLGISLLGFNPLVASNSVNSYLNNSFSAGSATIHTEVTTMNSQCLTQSSTNCESLCSALTNHPKSLVSSSNICCTNKELKLNDNLHFTNNDQHPIKSWANVSYWEANKHVGRKWFEVKNHVLTIVYEGQPAFNTTRKSNEDEICLSSLACHSHFVNHTPSQSLFNGYYNYGNNLTHMGTYSDRVVHSQNRSPGWRQCLRLGNQGICLTLTPNGCIWLDNRTFLTNLPIFVTSPCLVWDGSSMSAERTVYRVPAGCSILVFDTYHYQMFIQSKTENNPSCIYSNHISKNPVIHISLGKGWGPSYRRPDITHCPARLELWININSLVSLRTFS